MQQAEEQHETCDCGRPHEWAELEPFLRQYVDDVLAAESADTMRRGRARMIDAGAGADMFDAQMAAIEQALPPDVNMASVRKFVEVMRMPVAATTVRLVEAFTQARALLRGETSRWAGLPASDRQFVRTVIRRCDDDIMADLLYTDVVGEVTREAFAALGGVSPSLSMQIGSSMGVMSGMAEGTESRSIALNLALDALAVKEEPA